MTKTVACATFTSTGTFSVTQLKTQHNNMQEAITFPLEELHFYYFTSGMADPITFHVALH